MIYYFCLVFLFIFSFPSNAGTIQSSKESTPYFTEDFNDLSQWEPLYFAKIPHHSTYTIHTDTAASYVKAESNASASALILQKRFNVYDYPIISWRWKIENTLKKGNAQIKEGDDYPIRVYILFEYNPKDVGIFERVKYKAAKLIYGQYPPVASLNYIWANKDHKENIIENTYSKKSKMIPLQIGDKNKGVWITEHVHVIEDYIRAFGKKPPSTARIAIMNDSDNTQEHAVSYIDFIRISSP